MHAEMEPRWDRDEILFWVWAVLFLALGFTAIALRLMARLMVIQGQ